MVRRELVFTRNAFSKGRAKRCDVAGVLPFAFDYARDVDDFFRAHGRASEWFRKLFFTAANRS